MLSAEEYFNRGLAKLRKGDLDGAIEDFSQAIGLKPDYAEALNGRGAAKLKSAIKDLNQAQAIGLKTKHAEVWNDRGAAKLKSAIKDFDQAIVINPKSVQALYNRGLAKTEAHDLAGAIKDFSQAIELKPDYVKAWNDRGVAKAKDGDLDGAIKDFGQAKGLDFECADAWYNCGVAKEKNGDLDGAIEDFGQAIRRKPKLAQAWFNRGFVKADKGCLVGAKEDFDQASKLKHNFVGDLYIPYVRKFRGIFLLVLKAVFDLLRVLIEDNGFKSGKHPMHYTNLCVMKSLAQGEAFRLYSCDRMKDREEGRAIFDFFDKERGKKLASIFHTKSSEIDTYIGSFTTDNYPELENTKMWRTYGKHKNEKGAGCALVFEEGYLLPPESVPIGEIFTAKALLSKVFAPHQDIERCLYPVCYKPSVRILHKINVLDEVLEIISNKKYKKMHKITADLLDYVRYLFKDEEEYGWEKESRLIVQRPLGSGLSDASREREYFEWQPDMKRVTILLGPSARDKEELEQCLNEKDVFKEIKSARS